MFLIEKEIIQINSLLIVLKRESDLFNDMYSARKQMPFWDIKDERKAIGIKRTFIYQLDIKSASIHSIFEQMLVLKSH